MQVDIKPQSEAAGSLAPLRNAALCRHTRGVRWCLAAPCFYYRPIEADVSHLPVEKEGKGKYSLGFRRLHLVVERVLTDSSEQSTVPLLT